MSGEGNAQLIDANSIIAQAIAESHISPNMARMGQ